MLATIKATLQKEIEQADNEKVLTLLHEFLFGLIEGLYLKK